MGRRRSTSRDKNKSTSSRYQHDSRERLKDTLGIRQSQSASGNVNKPKKSHRHKRDKKSNRHSSSRSQSSSTDSSGDIGGGRYHSRRRDEDRGSSKKLKTTSGGNHYYHRKRKTRSRSRSRSRNNSRRRDLRMSSNADKPTKKRHEESGSRQKKRRTSRSNSRSPSSRSHSSDSSHSSSSRSVTSVHSSASSYSKYSSSRREKLKNNGNERTDSSLNTKVLSAAELQAKIEAKLDIGSQINRMNAIEELEQEGFVPKSFKATRASNILSNIPLPPLELKPLNMENLEKKEILVHPELLRTQREREQQWFRRVYHMRQKLFGTQDGGERAGSSSPECLN